ncbi:MAG: sigma-70 family RNA polymerase sigma factor [Planctomycetota bacterium]
MREDELEPEELQAIDRRLRGLARRLVGDESSAGDLVQDAWVSALSNTGTPIRRLGAWLTVAVRRSSSRAARERRRRADLEELMAARSAAVDDSGVEARDAAAALRRMIDELADPYREVMRLRHVDEVSIPDIAERLERSPSTVRSQLTRGVDQLRTRLQEREDLRPAIVALAFPRGSTTARAAAAAPSVAVPLVAFVAIALVAVTLLSRLLQSPPVPADDAEVAVASTGDGHEIAEAPDAAAAVPVASTTSRREEVTPVLSESDFDPRAEQAATPPDRFALRLKVEVLNADGTPARDAALGFRGLTEEPIDRTARDGRFDVVLDERELERRSGHPSVWVRAISLTEAWSEPHNVSFRDREASFQVRTGGPRTGLVGRVVDPAGRAVEGARVELLPTVDKGIESVAPNVSSFELGFERVSGPDGRFEFLAVTGGIWRLIVSADGYSRREQPVELETEGQEIEVALEEPRVLAGRVRDDRGRAVPDARVWIPDYMNVDRILHETRTDDDGLYELVGVTEHFWVFAETAGASSVYASQHVRMASGGRTNVDLEIAERPGLTFDVAAADGSMLPHQALVLLCVEGETIWSDFIEADADGRARARRTPLEPMDVFLGGQRDAGPVQLAAAVVRRDEPYALTVPVTVVPTGEVTATLIDPLGDPVEGVAIELVNVDLIGQAELDAGPGTWRAEYHDVFGAVHASGLPPARFLVEARVAGKGMAAFGPFEVEDGAVDLGELVMPELRGVQISWAADPPSPRSTWSLFTVDALAKQGERVVTSFSRPPEELQLYPGAYRLTHDRSEAQMRFEVAADGPAIVRVE